MHFDLNEEQQALADSIAKQAPALFPFQARGRRGAAFDAAKWQEIADLGWLALTLPESADGRSLLQNGAFAQQIAQVEVDILALEATVLRLVSAAKRGQGNGAEASVLKLHGTAVAQRITGLLVDALGEDINSQEPIGAEAADPTPAALASQQWKWRKLTIYGGSDEVQRNIIAKVALGL